MPEKPAEHIGKRKDGCSATPDLLGCDVNLIAPLSGGLQALSAGGTTRRAKVKDGRVLSFSHDVNSLARATGHVSGKLHIFKAAQGRECSR